MGSKRTPTGQISEVNVPVATVQHHKKSKKGLTLLPLWDGWMINDSLSRTVVLPVSESSWDRAILTLTSAVEVTAAIVTHTVSGRPCMNLFGATSTYPLQTIYTQYQSTPTDYGSHINKKADY